MKYTSQMKNDPKHENCDVPSLMYETGWFVSLASNEADRRYRQLGQNSVASKLPRDDRNFCLWSDQAVDTLHHLHTWHRPHLSGAEKNQLNEWDEQNISATTKFNTVENNRAEVTRLHKLLTDANTQTRHTITAFESVCPDDPRSEHSFRVKLNNMKRVQERVMERADSINASISLLAESHELVKEWHDWETLRTDIQGKTKLASDMPTEYLNFTGYHKSDKSAGSQSTLS